MEQSAKNTSRSVLSHIKTNGGATPNELMERFGLGERQLDHCLSVHLAGEVIVNGSKILPSKKHRPHHST